MCAHNKLFVVYCSKWEGLLRMRCKQAELRPDFSFNSSRNRSRPTLEQWASSGRLDTARFWEHGGERERERGAGLGNASGSNVEVGSVCLGFRQNLSEKHWGWWGERDRRSGFEHINLSNAKCLRGNSKCMWRSAGSGSFFFFFFFFFFLFIYFFESLKSNTLQKSGGRTHTGKKIHNYSKVIT